jgi:DNA polymerase I-like protein with 3'-5' exonuclease and polymerase domains
MTLPSLAPYPRIAIDIESCDPDLRELGPGPRRGSFVAGLAIGLGDERIYLPTAHLGGGNVENPEQVKAWARQEICKYSGEIVGANIVYDLEFLAESWGVRFHPAVRFVDIQIAETLLDAHKFSYALDTIARHHLGVGKDETLLRAAAAEHGWKSEREIKSNLWRLSGDLVRLYAEGDVDLPLRILPKQLVKLEEEGLMRVFDVECRLTRVLLAMRRHGVRVDLARARYVRRVLAGKRDECLARIRGLAGPGAQLMAPESLAPALAERGLTVPVTATGKPSVERALLARHRGDPLVDAIAAGRRLAMLVTQIESHVIEPAFDGRVYCQYHQLRGEAGGTIARLSSATPNNQNLAGREKPLDAALGLGESLWKLVRSIYVAEDGEEWRRHDFSQIEFRLLADCAVGPGADDVRRRYRDDPDVDFHEMCAEMADMDAERFRPQCKSVNFCKIYGGGNGTLAAEMGVTVEEAAAFRRRYDMALPFVDASFRYAMNWAARHGMVRTVLGRRMRFDRWEPRNERGAKALPPEAARAEYGPYIRRAFTYAALNHKLQGSAADILKKAMVDIWEAGVNDVLGPPVLTVHDELDHSVPRTKAGEEAAAEARQIMEQCIEIAVPIVVDEERGPNWGQLE